MSDVKIFWDPNGFELDSLGTKRLQRVTDGDTPYVSLSIRMLSIDTPEVHFPGNQNPAKHDGKLRELAEWIEAGDAPMSDGLAAYVRPKLVTGKAGSLQREQGEAATQKFRQLLEERLTKPNGTKRQVFLRAADEHFDQYGRLLAYMAPNYSQAELETMSFRDRATFNLLMVESGWAASFPIYPSLPNYRDLVFLRDAARDAFEKKRGAWSDPAVLTGYEFRMCFRLWEVTRKLVRGEKLSSRQRHGWVERYCVDMTTCEIYQPQDYHKVAPYNRVFVWPNNLNEAVGKMNLVPG